MTIVSETDIEELRFSLKNRLGEALMLTSQEDMLRYCRDWHGDVTSSAVAVIRPRSTPMGRGHRSSMAKMRPLRGYSRRSASIGSSCAARHAG